jgi:hypothetical protein
MDLDGDPGQSARCQTGWTISEREARVAENEATSRDINDRIEQAHANSPDDHFRILCECGRSDCERVIAITVPEYEALRSDARDFEIVTSHVMLDVEDIVRDTERFTVVRKHEGTPAAIAGEKTPRPNAESYETHPARTNSRLRRSPNGWRVGRR